MATEPQLDEKEKTLAGLKLAPPHVAIGVDIGKMHDPTTICVAEASQRWSGRWQHIPEELTLRGFRKAQDIPILETLFQVRFVSRIPLGTDYPVVALMLASLLDNPQLRGRQRVVRVDITGVGRPVYDMLIAEVRRMPEHKLIQCVPVTFRHGDEWHKEKGVLGKAYGVSRAQSLIQRGLVKVPADRPGLDAAQRQIIQEVLAMLEEL